jgi:serine O-acetyltransferase
VRDPRGLSRLLAADYAFLYDGRSETVAERRRRALVRFVTNPSLHAVVLIRLALVGPPLLTELCRNVLLAKHSIDIERGAQIGPGLNLPHPFGILFGGGLQMGEDVLLYHNVTLGALGSEPSSSEGPVIGDRVIIHTNTMVAPNAVVGEGATVGANSFVDGLVPAGAVFARGRIVEDGARPGAGS